MIMGSPNQNNIYYCLNLLKQIQFNTFIDLTFRSNRRTLFFVLFNPLRIDVELWVQTINKVTTSTLNLFLNKRR